MSAPAREGVEQSGKHTIVIESDSDFTRRSVCQRKCDQSVCWTLSLLILGSDVFYHRLKTYQCIWCMTYNWIKRMFIGS
eukprot:scaffold1953_cov176-Amphora_coffeaeformis.AAC.10